MSTPTTRCRALLALLATAALSGPVMACLEIPPDPPDIWIVVTGPNDANVIIHDFHTYGATAGADYCACALNVPALYGQVVSADIVDANTGVPLPGFSFGQDPDTETGFQGAAPLSPPEFWTGFSSAVSSTIAAGLPVDIVFHITSQDRPFDWNGLADQFRNAGAVLATDAAAPDGTPTGAHQSIQPAAIVGVEVNAFGLPHRPLGQATLNRSGGQLVVSNIGSSGKDGVSISPPPDTQGAGIQLGPETCPATGPSPPGRGIGLRSFNVDSFFDITYRVSLSDRWTAEVHVPTPPACMQVQLYEQGQLQVDECVPAGQPLIDMSSDVCPTQVAWLELPSPRMRLLLDQTTPIQVGGAPAPVDADELHIFIPGALPAPPSFYEMYGFSDSFFDIYIDLETVQIFGNQHHTVGQALYGQPSSSGRLKVSNLGSSGEDGVRSVQPVHPRFIIDSFFDVWTELVVDPDPTGGAANGSYVEYSADGLIQGIPGSSPLGSTRAAKIGSAHRVTADFSPVGSSTTRLEFYDNGTLVAEFNGMSNPLFDHAEWPDAVGKLSSGWPPGLSCFVQTWPAAVNFSVHGFPGRGIGSSVNADEVRILAEGGTPVDGVTSLSVQASGYPSVELAGQTTSPPADSDLDGVPDAVDNCVFAENPSQCDTDGDNFGNHCDADLNNDNSVNTFDLNIMRAQFGGTGDADLDCSGLVNTFDLNRMRQLFGLPPGPSGH